MSIRYISYDPDDGHSETPDLQAVLSDVERTLQYARTEEGWVVADLEETYAGVVVPVLIVEEVVKARREDFTDEQWEEMGHSSDYDEVVAYPTRSINAGLLAIIEERQRQIAKGWTPAHDALHDAGEIARAALVKLAIAALGGEVAQEIVGGLWPWEHTFGGDTSDPRKLLAEAGALIAAELDRIAAAADAGGEK